MKYISEDVGDGGDSLLELIASLRDADAGGLTSLGNGLRARSGSKSGVA